MIANVNRSKRSSKVWKADDFVWRPLKPKAKKSADEMEQVFMGLVPVLNGRKKST